jgi:hypothetical protein
MAVKNMHKKSLEPERLAQSSQKNAINLSLGSMELLSEYFELSYEGLLEELLDSQLVEEGFAKRDYALGCLVSFHFDKLRFRELFILTPFLRQMWKMLSYGSIRH